jgi:cell division protein FtsL
MTPLRWLVFAVAWIMLFSSAMGVIWSKHQSRSLFVELQKLEKQRDRLDVEWGQLKLQQSKDAAHGRVEQFARAQLRMTIPTPTQVSLVKANMPKTLPAALSLSQTATLDDSSEQLQAREVKQ